MSDPKEKLAAALSDRYTIERELGAGGMATVYLAHDVKHDRKVAVKVLRPELAAVLGAERFLNEIKVTANLQHPHILPLHDSGEADSFLYYVMPYVEGESLREKLNRDKQLSIEESIDITKSVATALDYAHRHEVIHRDIKPENILLHDGQPVVADFGIALAVTAAGGTRLTETGLSLGTPQYMSPEQATGDREIDGRSDIYSLACVLYEMLAGDPPHTGSTVQAVIAKVVTDQPRPITELRDTAPCQLSAAVHKALAKLPADRFVTTAKFAQALTAEDTAVAGTRRQTEWSGMGRFIAGVIAATVVLVIAAWWVLRAPESDGAGIERIAVLPPDNLTGQPERDFFLEGMHDRLITVLGQVVGAEVDVLGRRSVMRYRDSDMSVPAIAGELSVDALIELSAAVSGDSVHVTARLIRAVPEAQLWADTYGRELQHINALYSDVAHAVAQQIGAVMSPDDPARPTPARPVDPEAYALYLRGRLHQNRLDPIETDLETAISYFEQALGEDSTFAPAYAGIALAYAILGGFNIIAPDSAWPKMEVAADRAMEYASELAEAQLAHAVRAYYRWNWTTAERVLERLLAINPNDVDAAHWSALTLSVLGEIDGAVELARRMAALEPRDPFALLRLSWIFDAGHRWDESLALNQRILAEWPDYPLAYWQLATAYTGRGDLDSAVTAIQKAIAVMEPDDLGDEYGVLGYLYGRLGREAEARAQLEQQNRLEHSGRYISPIARALVYTGLGEDDVALALLEQGYDTQAGWMGFVMTAPYLESLRRHPRYQDLRRRLNLPTQDPR